MVLVFQDVASVQISNVWQLYYYPFLLLPLVEEKLVDLCRCILTFTLMSKPASDGKAKSGQCC